MLYRFFVSTTILLPLFFDLIGLNSMYTMAVLLMSVLILSVDLFVRSLRNNTFLLPRMKTLLPLILFVSFVLISVFLSNYGPFILGEAQLYSTSLVSLACYLFYFYYLSCLSTGARRDLVRALLLVGIFGSIALLSAFLSSFSAVDINVPFRLLFFVIIVFWLYTISFDRSMDIISNDKARRAINWILFAGFVVSSLTLLNPLGILLSSFGALLAYFALKDYSKALNEYEQNILVLSGIVLLSSAILWLLGSVAGVRFSFFEGITSVLIVPSVALSFGIFTEGFNLKNALFGSGLGSFPHEFLLNAPVEFFRSSVWNVQFARATNGILHFIIELGSLSLLAFGYFVYSLIASSLKTLKHRYDSLQFLSIAGLLLSLLAILLLPVSFSTLMLLTIFAGILAHSRKLEFSNNFSSRVFSLTAFLLLIVMCSYSLFALSNRARIIRVLGNSSDSPTVQSLVVASRAIQNTLGYDVGYRMLAQYLTDFINFNESTLAEEDLARYLQALEFASLEAVSVNGNSVFNWGIASDVYKFLLRYDRGLVGPMNMAYERASLLAPNRPDILVKKAEGLILSSSLARSSEAGANLDEEELLAEAKILLDRAILIRPSYGPAYSALALYHEQNDDLESALSALEELRFNNPNSPELLYDIGILNLRLERPDVAVSAFVRALELFPAYTNAYWFLSVAYEEAGDTQSSIEVLEEMVAQGFVDKRILQRLKRLRDGGEAPAELPAPLGTTEDLGLDD